MASRKKKKGFRIQFELGIGGLFSVGIVVFCLFLWLFLFGVWTGQSLLEPNGEGKDSFSHYAMRLWKAEPPKQKRVSTPVKKPTQSKSKPNVEDQRPTHFSLQVAAFRDEDKARKVVLQWRARDYTSFYLPPDQPNGTFYRVFVGDFDTMTEAKGFSEKLKGKEKNKYFITLLPLSEKRYP